MRSYKLVECFYLFLFPHISVLKESIHMNVIEINRSFRQVFSFSKKQIQTTCGYLVKRESLLTWSKRLFFRLYKENRDDNKK